MQVVFRVSESRLLDNTHTIFLGLNLLGILWSLSIFEHEDLALGVLVDSKGDGLVLKVIHLV